MNSYEPPFTITNQMIEKISSISEKIGKISFLRNIDQRPHLRRNNRIKSIHSSLKIEANSLSFNDVKDVIDGHIVYGDVKEIQEVKNAYKAYSEISKINIYNVEELKRIHGIMTFLTVEESGKFRKGAEGVFDGDICIFIAPPANMVSDLMNELFEWLKRNKNNIHPLILSSIFHYEFIFIHPFSDGNGRMARLWQTAILTNWRNIFEYIPLESQIEKYQKEYYEAIATCHKEGNSNCFIDFSLGMIDKIVDEFINQINSNEVQTEYVKKLMSVMEYDISYTAKTLLKKLNLKSRETFRKNYLNPAIESGLVEMTIPDKPNSRNQCYKKI